MNELFLSEIILYIFFYGLIQSLDRSHFFVCDRTNLLDIHLESELTERFRFGLMGSKILRLFVLTGDLHVLHVPNLYHLYS